jgi:hypothetical protein
MALNHVIEGNEMPIQIFPMSKSPQALQRYRALDYTTADEVKGNMDAFLEEWSESIEIAEGVTTIG